MEVKIDKEKCVACGLCQTLCPEVFELQGDSSAVKKGADLEKNKNGIKEAAENCPMGAIIIEEE